MISTTDCSIECVQMDRARALLSGADRVAVGVGPGFSAAGGLDENSTALVKRWLPGFAELGLDSLRAVRAIIGPLKQNRPEVYWGFWGQYLLQSRYQLPVLEGYRLLSQLDGARVCFFAAATTDGQLERAGIPEARRFTPLGDGRWFQCAQPCCEQRFDNETQLRTMVEYLMTPREIDTRDVPACPCCGGPLIPNLREAAGDAFVDAPYLETYPDYQAFLAGCAGHSAVLLELGVGDSEAEAFIRTPFERLALEQPSVALIRAGEHPAPLPAGLGDRGVLLAGNPMDILRSLLSALSGDVLP